MNITGSNVVPHPVDKVWDALLDPRVLVATIPGCERLETTGEHEYAMTVTAGVAAIRGTYSGSCRLSDLEPHQSLVMHLQGAGAPGTIGATVRVSFEDLGAEGTRISYDADAIVGGMVGGVGQRMLTSVARRMAGEFFANVAAAISAPTPVEPVGASSVEPVLRDAARSSRPSGTISTTAARGAVFTAPPRSTGISSRDDFVKGIAVGAGLVLLGVAAGSLFGRRRP